MLVLTDLKKFIFQNIAAEYSSFDIPLQCLTNIWKKNALMASVILFEMHSLKTHSQLQLVNLPNMLVTAIRRQVDNCWQTFHDVSCTCVYKLLNLFLNLSTTAMYDLLVFQRARFMSCLLLQLLITLQYRQMLLLNTNHSFESLLRTLISSYLVGSPTLNCKQQFLILSWLNDFLIMDHLGKTNMSVYIRACMPLSVSQYELCRVTLSL